jgi:hypothetical protein
VDRLTDEDQRMLWPDEIWPQEIGALAVLDRGLTGPGGRVRVEAVREVIAARLRLVPRFRQLLAGRMPHVLGWFELAASTISIGDAIILLRSWHGSIRRRRPRSDQGSRSRLRWLEPRVTGKSVPCWVGDRSAVEAGGAACHQGTGVPSQEKNCPVGPSSGSSASQTAPAAASAGSPPLAAAVALRSVRRRPGASALTLMSSSARVRA